MSLAAGLLQQAKDLLAQDPRKPRQVNLRRAVSTGIMPRKRVLSLSISIST